MEFCVVIDYASGGLAGDSEEVIAGRPITALYADVRPPLFAAADPRLRCEPLDGEPRLTVR